MLQLVQTLPEGISELRQELIDSGIPTLVDYDSIKGEFSTTRTIFVDTGWDAKKLTAFLITHPGACIYNTVSHKPISEDKVMLDGEPYIDLFGLNVYIKSDVSWYPHEDVDERFNDEVYPDNITPEFEHYFL